MSVPANGTGQSDGSVSGARTCGRAQFNNMAQLPFMSPTVFNFYPPDYGIPGTTLIGPEFAIMTTGTAIARATFINQMTFATEQRYCRPQQRQLLRMRLRFRFWPRTARTARRSISPISSLSRKPILPAARWSMSSIEECSAEACHRRCERLSWAPCHHMPARLR